MALWRMEQQYLCILQFKKKKSNGNVLVSLESRYTVKQFPSIKKKLFQNPNVKRVQQRIEWDMFLPFFAWLAARSFAIFNRSLLICCINDFRKLHCHRALCELVVDSVFRFYFSQFFVEFATKPSFSPRCWHTTSSFECAC